jgi:hypothetical protein
MAAGWSGRVPLGFEPPPCHSPEVAFFISVTRGGNGQTNHATGKSHTLDALGLLRPRLPGDGLLKISSALIKKLTTSARVSGFNKRGNSERSTFDGKKFNHRCIANRCKECSDAGTIILFNFQGRASYRLTARSQISQRFRSPAARGSRRDPTASVSLAFVI